MGNISHKWARYYTTLMKYIHVQNIDYAHRSFVDPLQHIVGEVHGGQGDGGPGDVMVAPLKVVGQSSH